MIWQREVAFASIVWSNSRLLMVSLGQYQVLPRLVDDIDLAGVVC